MNRLSILVLHCLGDPAYAPSFLNHHVFALQKNYSEHDYLYHDATLPIPEYVVEHTFDAIVLDVTFLMARWRTLEFFQGRKAAYAFVAESRAVKIAFPQDEYDCNLLLDDWMCEWKVDVVFSVIASGWDVLYPRYHKFGEIRLGYTGYIDESLIDRPVKHFQSRTIDIGYRAKKLPPYFGRIGQTKWTIGRDVSERGRQARLNVDIELGDQGTLFGDAWLEFINDSKFTLGANSGSSLVDPVGDIQRHVRSYLAFHPEATFEEVETACFPGLDGQYSFTAISPRVLEAALLNSAQILVEGEYSDIVKPGEHYISIRQDASNFDEVLMAMSDSVAVEAMIKRCREAVLSVEALRYRNKAKMILDLIGDMSDRNKSEGSPERIQKVIARYKNEMLPKYKAHWRAQDFRATVNRVLAPHPRINHVFRMMTKVLRQIRSKES